MTTPDWLTDHEATLKPGLPPHTWYVVIAGKPQYRLALTPADGKYSCAVSQTVNGKRIDRDTVRATETEAFQAGLEALRQHLGW